MRVRHHEQVVGPAAPSPSTADQSSVRNPADRRFLTLDGCFNFRDLGGYPTGDGRVVARGRIYRSDALHRLSQAGRNALVDLGVATVIDLRTGQEVEERRWEPPAGWAGRWRHLPLRAAVPDWGGLTSEQACHPDLAVGHYQQTVIEGAAVLARIFAELADPASLPAVFHCAAGKDRTGIVAALLLRLLDVDLATTADDYALSEIATHRWQSSIAGGTPDDTQTAWAYVPPAMLTADASVMTAVLAWIDTEHRSVEDLLRPHGLRSTSVAQLRDHLLSSANRDR